MRSKGWPNRDPIGERIAINLYEFTGNDSIDRRDRNGLDYSTQCASKCNDDFVSCMLDSDNGAGIGIGTLGGYLYSGGKFFCKGTGIGLLLGAAPQATKCYAALFGCLSGCPAPTPYPIAPPGSGCSICPVNNPPVMYGR